MVIRGDQTFELDTAAIETIEGEEVLVQTRQVKFIKTGLLDRFLRLGARPETAFLFLLFGLAFAVFGMAVPASSGAAEITLNMGHPFPEKLATLTSWEKWFAGEIEKRTSGRVKIKIFWSQSLGKTSDLPDLDGLEVTIAVENAYLPFNYIDPETGEPAGWDYVVWDEICNLLNCVPVYIEAGWEGMIQAVADGQFDAVKSTHRTAASGHGLNGHHG